MIINVNGIDLFYEKTGSGHPVLLLHGNGEDHHIFDALAAKLSAHYSLYLVDSRNHGESGKSGDFSYGAMAADILGLINALGISPHIVGFSDGAIIALLLAMKHGGTFSKLALLGPNLSPADFTDESLDYIRNAYAASPDPLLKLMLEEPNIKPGELAGIENEALVIGGEDDIFNPETFPMIAAALPNAGLKIMAGHSHDSYINGSDLLYGDLKAFLGGA